MWARLSIVAGLVVGVVAAGLLLGGLIALAPETPLPSVAAPPAAGASVAPSVAVPSATAVPTVAPVAVPSATAVPTVAPASSPADGPSQLGQPAAALGEIGPDAVAEGLETMMPGVDVTP